MQKYNISAVSYLNSIPFIYGFEHYTPIFPYIELSRDYPAVCAEKLKSGEVDIGLIPVAEYPNVPNHRIISDYCIGAVDAVKTVLLLSDVPLPEIKKIYPDYQSRTSVNLMKLLAKDYWQINPEYLPAAKGYETKIGGDTAGLIIGDRTFNLSKSYKYQYDLAEEWHKYTGKPFTFAVWAANKKIDSSFIQLFNEACRYGLNSMDAVLKEYSNNSFTGIKRLKSYLTNDISYKFDSEKQEATEDFLNRIRRFNNS